MRDSCDTEPSLVVVSGGREEALESIDIILGFLLTDIIINQKSIDTFERLRDGSLGSSCFRFWLNVETGSEKAVALAYTRGGGPVLVAGTSRASLAFWLTVLSQDREFQGEVSSLELMFQSARFTHYTVNRKKILMSCTALTIKQPHHNQLLEYEVRIGQETDLDQLTQMQFEFAAAVEQVPISSVTLMMKRGTYYIACPTGTDQIVSMVYKTNPNSSVSRITFVFTRESHRGKGLSRRLMFEATKSALDKCQACTLFVDPANHAANSTYASVGFMQVAQYQIRKLGPILSKPPV
jgi:ribosomal protein S18 acetylase RimI-like enzyme